MFPAKFLVFMVVLVSAQCVSENYHFYYHEKHNSSNTRNDINTSVSVKTHVANGVSVTPHRKKSQHNFPFVIIKNSDITLKSPVLRVSTVGVGVPIPPAKRRSKIDVNPVQQNCKSPEFKDGLKALQSKVRCKPRPSIIYLESPTKSTLIPNAVLAKRCDGSCSAAHKCIPTKITNTTYYVREIKLNTVYCTSVVIPEHEACKCDCPKKATECNVKQEYDKETCTCNCKNKNEFNRCLQRKNIKWVWEEEECACMCVEMKYCTTGTTWNPYHCKCESTT